jgi:large subunit ribosomal protein L24
MAVQTQNNIRFSNSPIAKKHKSGGRTVVSRALIQEDATNLRPHIHVKRGDMVMLISGPRKEDKKREKALQKRFDERNAFKGTVGKVLSVSPKDGTVTVEGVNIVTRASKPRGPMSKSGLITREGPLFASRVMLYCTACKKPTRIKHKTLDSGKKTRLCQHCQQAFDA